MTFHPDLAPIDEEALDEVWGQIHSARLLEASPHDVSGEARDKSGKWTAGAGSSGGKAGDHSHVHAALQMYSPNVREGTKWEDAEQMIHGQRQQWVRTICADVDRQLGMHDESSDAIGEWSDGAEGSVVSHLPPGDFEKIRYSAAIKGLLLKQKAVIAFNPEDGGPDSVYEFKVNQPADVVRKALTKAGIEYRTLGVAEKETTVTIVDIGSSLTQNAMEAGHDLGVEEITTTRGRGEFLGGDTREAGREDYRRIIEEYEANAKDDRHYKLPSGESLSDYWAGHAETGKRLHETAADNLSRRAVELWETMGKLADDGYLLDGPEHYP